MKTTAEREAAHLVLAESRSALPATCQERSQTGMETSMLDPTVVLSSLFAEETAIFVDFDGTLVPIAEHPDAIEVAGTTIALLQRLQKHTSGALAVISGRSVDELRGFLAPANVALTGSHGLELFLPGEQVTRKPVDTDALKEAVLRLSMFAQEDERLIVEKKPASVALHYRQAPERRASCEHFVQGILKASPSLQLLAGKMVLELKAGKGDKATAIRELMQLQPFAGRLPIFAGDDITDELAFPTVQALGGLAIKVGAGQTSANLRFADVPEFLVWLEALAGQSDAHDVSVDPKVMVS